MPTQIETQNHTELKYHRSRTVYAESAPVTWAAGAFEPPVYWWVTEDPSVTCFVLPQQDVPTIVRNLSEVDARREIRDFVKTTPGLDAFDIAIALNLDIDFTEQICEELANDGQITADPIPLENE